MTHYHGAQLHHIDPDENRIPQDIRIKFTSDCGVTKWMNIDYEVFDAIADIMIDSEKESHNLSLISSGVQATPAINKNNGG